MPERDAAPQIEREIERQVDRQVDRLTERVTELEIALAHAERLAEDLSDLAREQAERTARLDRQVAALIGRVAAVEAGATMPPPAERRPPHW